MFLKGLFDSGYKELKRVEKIAKKIDALADDYKKLTVKPSCQQFLLLYNDEH